jgi:predicted DNA-binding transcriptional regulator YafY
MNRTDRLLGILLELQARRAARAEDLAGVFEVSVRTIYRDVQALSETGVPIMATPGKGYALMPGYFLPPLAFTATEAGLLVIGGEFIRERVDADLRRAANDAPRKLVNVLPADRQSEIDRWRRDLMFLPTRLPTDERLAHIRSAVEGRHVIRMRYHAHRRDEPEERDVEPITLIHMADVWHLAAWCRMRQAERLFRLDRIDHFEVLPEVFALAARHRLDPARRYPVEAHPEARVRFDASAERWARERQPFFFLREESSGGASLFVYSLRDERALVAWLLQWGAAAEVLEPASLRRRIADEARAIIARNG